MKDSKLLFDLNATQPNHDGKRHGGGKYGEMVFFRLIERHVAFSCFFDSQKWLNPEIKKDCDKNGVVLYDISKSGIDSIIEKSEAKILYSSIPSRYAHIKGCRIVGTLHGLRGLETPFDSYFYKYSHSFSDVVKFTIKKIFQKWYYQSLWKEYKKNYFQSGMDFVTISEHTKNAICCYFPEYSERNIKVFYTPSTSSNDEIERDNSLGQYFLLVSGNRWEKNNLRAIIAFDTLLSKQLITNVKMVVLGASSKTFKYHIKNPDNFMFYDYVSEEILNKMYANAYLFVYPSLNEGFGLPPLEALRYKVPVISSSFTSMAEILLGGAIFFNPFSIDEIMNRMMMMMNPLIHQKLSVKGYQRYEEVNKRQKEDLDKLIDYILGE